MSLPHSRTSSQIVLDHISKYAKTQLTERDVVIRNVRMFRGKVGINTAADLVAVPGGKFEGQKEIHYNRKDIGQVVKGVALTIPPKGQRHNVELLGDINAKYGFKLVDSDIEIERIYATVAPIKVRIKMREDNPAWTGILEVTLSNPESALGWVIDNDVIRDNILPGVIKDKIQAGLLYYAVDFSPMSNQLSQIQLGHHQSAALSIILNAMVDEFWVVSSNPAEFNLNGCVVQYNGPSSQLSERRVGFSKQLQVLINDDACTNVSGLLIINYN